MGNVGDPIVLAASVHWFSGWSLTGNFTTLDLIAVTANALAGALLARRPDHYRNFTAIASSPRSVSSFWRSSVASSAGSSATFC